MKLFHRERWAIQINRVYNGEPLEPEYVVGAKRKIAQLFDDYNTQRSHFEREMMQKDGLSSPPELIVTGGRFGFVPGKNVPITMIAQYTYNHVGQKKSGGFISAMKLFLLIILVSVLGFVGLGAFAAMQMSKGVELLDQYAHECNVMTKDGKPHTITMYGETLFYDRDGEIILPDLREVLPQEMLAHKQPFKYCNVVAIDGKAPAR